MFSLRCLLAVLFVSVPLVNAGLVPITQLPANPDQVYTLLNPPADATQTTMTIAYDSVNGFYYIGTGADNAAPVIEADGSGLFRREIASNDDRGVEFRDNKIYITDFASNEVFLLDPSGLHLQLVPYLTLQSPSKGWQSFANTDGSEWISSQDTGEVQVWANDGSALGSVTLQGFNVDYNDADFPGDVLASCGNIWLTYAFTEGIIFAWSPTGQRLHGWQLPPLYVANSQVDVYSISYTNNKFWVNNDWTGFTFYGFDLGFSANCDFPGGVLGDPQFTGFNGQSYQVHGTSGTVYNIISSPSFTYNALFTYLESGKCRQGTGCFSHPGNYFGAVGIVIRDSGNNSQELLVSAGDVAVGLNVVLNNATVAVSSAPLHIGDYTVSLPSAFELLLESTEFVIRVQNSDGFLNQDISIGSSLARQIANYKRSVKSSAEGADRLAEELPHGILGQSWSTKTYQNRWKHIQGQLFDYVVQDGILGHDFKYNRFEQ